MRAVFLAAAPAGARAATHRHTAHAHEHDFETQRGLPEGLPSGERILWQGAPDWRMLARECFHFRKLVVYFSLLIVWRVASVVGSGVGLREVLMAAAMAFGLAATALGLTALMAWMSARTTLYTVTDRRVVLRIGIVLTVTFNLPFRQIESADLHRLAAGHGDIALGLVSTTRIAYPHLWPHARPWHVARTQPSLRCIADAMTVAQLLTEAWKRARVELAVVVADVREPIAPILRRRDPPVRADEEANDVAQAA